MTRARKYAIINLRRFLTKAGCVIKEGNRVIEKMSSIQRVQAALNFEQPDYIPLIENYWGDFVARWRRQQHLRPLPDLPFEDVVEDLEISAYYGMDVAIAIPDESPWPSQAEMLGADRRYVIYRDGWGSVRRGLPGAEFAARDLEVVLSEKSDLDNLEFESPKDDNRYIDYLERVARLSTGEYRPYVVTKLGGPFFRPSRLRGYVRWLMDIAEDPPFVEALARRVTDHLIAIGLEAVRRSGLWHTSIGIFDDCADNSGLQISPKFYTRVFLPQIRRMVKAFKGAGVARVMFHSDGDIQAILDGLVEAGIDAINPVEPRANMDVVELRKRYGKRLAFVGGLCNSRILPQGTAAEVRDHVEHVLKAGEGGGLVVGSHSIGADISLERYEFVMRILAEHGRPLPS